MAGVRIGEESSDLVREVPRVDWVGEEPVPAVLDNLAHSRDVGDDDRLPGRHRLEGDDPERLESGDAREDEDVAGRIDLRALFVRDAPAESDAARDRDGFGEAPPRLEARPASRDPEPR